MQVFGKARSARASWRRDFEGTSALEADLRIRGLHGEASSCWVGYTAPLPTG